VLEALLIFFVMIVSLTVVAVLAFFTQNFIKGVENVRETYFKMYKPTNCYPHTAKHPESPLLQVPGRWSALPVVHLPHPRSNRRNKDLRVPEVLQ
jgi:hypothetical protein